MGSRRLTSIVIGRVLSTASLRQDPPLRAVAVSIVQLVLSFSECGERGVELFVRVFGVDGYPEARFALGNAGWADRLDEYAFFKEQLGQPHRFSGVSDDDGHDMRCACPDVESEL